MVLLFPYISKESSHNTEPDEDVVMSSSSSCSERCKGGSVSSDLCIQASSLPFFSMNGDMPHVPITTLAGIASLTDRKLHKRLLPELV